MQSTEAGLREPGKQKRVSVGCGLDAKFPCVGFGFLIFGREEGIALFRCHVGALLGTRHLTRADGAIAGITNQRTRGT